VFSAIEIKWQDALSMAYAYDLYNDGVRMAIASLIVIYPLYILFSFLASRAVEKSPEKKELTIRKATIYTALFVTACTIVGTLISVIYNYLGGELSARFGMKALFIAALSAIVFGYYYYLMRRDYTKPTKVPLIIGALTSIFVIGSIVWSISIIGTPSEMRTRKFDDTRLQHLSSIQQQIFTTFQNSNRLAHDLNELNNALYGFSVPTDPETGLSYEYRVVKNATFAMEAGKPKQTGDAVFELCATFTTERNFGMPVAIDGVDPQYAVTSYYYPGDRTPFWNHGSGKSCFTRTITPSMYYGK
jgi:hypothetical protein